MSALADEILGQIADASEAGMIAHRIISHFGLAGTVFGRDDVRSAVDEHIDGYYDDYDDDTREVLVDEYMSVGDWSDISIYLTRAGDEAIAEGVAERMRELGV